MFPWDPNAAAGERFSRYFIPDQSGQGRFDLPHTARGSSWYFSESPEHAVAEKIQDLRNRTLADEFLFERGHRLALCAVELDPRLDVVDLCDPHELAARDIAPDQLAYRDRSVTQEIAAELHGAGDAAGLRWWSAFFGEWHTVVLFSDRRSDRDLSFGEPEALHLGSTAVASAAAALGIEIG